MEFIAGSQINGYCPPDCEPIEPKFTYCQNCGCEIYECDDDAYYYNICDYCYKLEQNENND